MNNSCMYFLLILKKYIWEPGEVSKDSKGILNSNRRWGHIVGQA